MIVTHLFMSYVVYKSVCLFSCFSYPSVYYQASLILYYMFINHLYLYL